MYSYVLDHLQIPQSPQQLKRPCFHSAIFVSVSYLSENMLNIFISQLKSNIDLIFKSNQIHLFGRKQYIYI